MPQTSQTPPASHDSLAPLAPTPSPDLSIRVNQLPAVREAREKWDRLNRESVAAFNEYHALFQAEIANELAKLAKEIVR